MWIVPSRGRADRVATMFNEAPPLTIGVVAVDDDDFRSYEKVKLPSGWWLDISPRRKYVEKHNRLFYKFPRESWYGSLSDDMVPLTEDWDKNLIERAGPWGVAYANDLYTRRCGAFVIGGELVRELGFVLNPRFAHFFGDTTLELMCRELSLAGLQEDIVVEHRHFGNKKHPGRYDRTSRERPELRKERPVYEDWLVKEWPVVKAKLQRSLCST